MTQIAAPSFLAALKLTQPGGSFAPVGELLPVTLKGLRFTPAITVDLKACTLTRLVVQDCVGLHFTGGEWGPAAVKEQVLVTGSDDVWFDDASTLSDGLATGFKIADSSNVRITNSRIDRAFQGINSGRVKNATYTGNDIVGQNNDGIVIYANDGLLIADNTITASLRLNGRHPDGIQFIYRVAEDIRSTDVKVLGNVIVLPAQGIFGGGVDRGEIRGNHVKVDHSNGIYFMAISDLKVLDNIVETSGSGNDWAQIGAKNGSFSERRGNVVKAHGRHAEVRD